MYEVSDNYKAYNTGLTKPQFSVSVTIASKSSVIRNKLNMSDDLKSRFPYLYWKNDDSRNLFVG